LEKTISVTSGGTAPLLLAWFEVNELLEGKTVLLNLIYNGQNPATNLKIDFDGDGGYEYDGSWVSQFTHLFPIAGKFTAHAIVTDNLGMQQSWHASVEVQTEANIAAKFNLLFDDYKIALMNGDIDAASNFMLSGRKDIFRPV